MALLVTQRPEEELFADENPTSYDTPYFTSRWNAANLPQVYKISNTKFPINTEDVIEDILSVSNNAGFAQLTLDSATYTFFELGFVKVTNTTNYNGVFEIRSVVDANNIVIDAPFVATETGNVQNYYNNYNTLVRVYAGLPEYHPLNSAKPLELITDNPITITPNSTNESVIDVSALVKSKLSLDNDYEVNDLNVFTAYYIDYAEQFDVSNGTSVTVSTSSFTEDEISGCDSEEGNFVTNGDFATNLNGWSNLTQGISWVQNAGAAQVTLSIADRRSKILSQSGLGLTANGEVEYSLDFDYNLGGNTVTITVSSGSIIYQESLTGSGTVSIRFFSTTDAITFDYNLTNAVTQVGVDLTLDNVSITNTGAANPCLAYIFATHSARQPQSVYGGNMGEYVQNFNGGQFLNRWLTLMEKPTLFKGNYFDLSTIIPQSVIQSAIQAGGFFLEIVEFDINKEVITENQYPITQNLGDGVYRFRLDDKTFKSNTKEFTVQILRIPVNLFVDGDQGTFDTTSNPNGNPPSDWNLEKDARSIINFDDTLSFDGAGSLKFDSRSIFNDDYGLQFTDEGIRGNSVQSIILNDQSGLAFNDDFTLEFRHRLNEYSGQFAYLFSIRQGGGDFFRFLYKPTLVTLQWTQDASIPTGDRYGILEASYTVGQFNHFVVSFNKDTSVSIYVNGVKTTTTNTPFIDPALNNNEILLFGGVDGNTFNADGYAKGVRIFEGYAANDADVANLYNGNTKTMQNIPISMTSFLEREFLLNQEQGRTAFESSGKNEELQNVLRWEESNVAFGGGAWVDVTPIN